MILKWSTLYKSFDLEQIVHAPTRVTERFHTLLDHIYISHGINIKEVSVSPLSISDHFPTAITVKEAGRIENGSHKVITYRKLKFVDYRVVISNIKKELSCNKSFNVNSELAKINDVIGRNYNKCSPLITERVRSINNIPWITERVRKAMRIRDTFKILGNTEYYRLWRNKCVNILRQNKKEHFKDLIESAKGSMKKLWTHINKLSKDTKINSPKTLKMNGIMITDNLSMATVLNNHFVSIVKNMLLNQTFKNEKYEVPVLLKQFISQRLPKNTLFNIPKITERFVQKQLETLNTRKGTGYDNISTTFLKICAPAIVPVLCHLLNQSIETGIYPNQWKIAKVTALFKGGDSMDVNNYRPISVLSVMSKILERHVYDSLYSYLTKYNLLTPYQSGFRSGYSCESCLLNMTNNWYKSINHGDMVGVVALDLSKAFDVLNHEIILSKLKIYGFSDVALLWFESYLKGRYQYVHINNINSEKLGQNHGVPQGSILGPLIFSLFMNDMPLVLNYVNLDLYADDTTLYVAGPSLKIIKKHLSQDLESFETWCETNYLLVNTKKSKCMVMHKKTKIFIK